MYQVAKICNVQYSSHPECLMELYIPACDKPCPLLMYMHGGGLEGGSRLRREADMMPLASEYGIAVANIDYRMYPNAKFPEFIEDCAQALRFVMDYPALQGKVSEYYIGGSSAGSYLTMMLFFDKRYLARQGIRVEDVSGYIFDAGQPTTHFNVLRERGMDTRLIRVDEAAPIYFIDRDNPYGDKQPRLFIIYSDNDMVNRLEQNRMLYRTLDHFHYDMSRVTMRCMEGFGHTEYCTAQGDDGRYIYPDILAPFILGK